MYSVCQSRKIRHVKRNADHGLQLIAGVVTVSAEKLTANKLKRCQQLALRKHKTDGNALILLSSPSLICVLSNSRTFTNGPRRQRCTFPAQLEEWCLMIKFIGNKMRVWTLENAKEFYVYATKNIRK